MSGFLYELARPFAFRLEPEAAHEAGLRALELGLRPLRAPFADPRLAVEAFGLRFPNPIGLAAGFDKDARVPDAMLAFGFGHVEIGSVTPRPQPGNPRPRLFRLVRDEAVINRMGFNSQGQEAAARRLAARRGRPGVVGVNLGANKDTVDKVADFATGVERLGEFASYLTINVSSPNTPGLRDLQMPDALSRLIESVKAARGRLAARIGRSPPIVVKLACDIAEDDLPELARRLISGGVDGAAISNTTLARDGLVETDLANEAGGLSGIPLFRRSTRMLARMFLATEGKLPLIGIGGVDSPLAARAKIAAGASLVQLYTGMVYRGPMLAEAINRGLLADMQKTGIGSLAAFRGSEATNWARAHLKGK